MEYRKGPTKDEGPQLVDIFQTEPGRLFGEQANQLLEFVMKGQLLTIMPIIGDFAQKMIDAISEGWLSEAINRTEKKPQPDDVMMIQALELLSQHLEKNEFAEGLELFPSAEDQLWYISLITFALYTYLDVYSVSLIDLIKENEILSSKLEKYLGKKAHERPDKTRAPTLRVHEMKRFGVKLRLTTFERGLEIDSVLAQLIGQVELEVVRNSFFKFVEIRGKIAHKNPRLGQNEYSYQKFEKDLENIGIDFKETEDFMKKIGLPIEGISQILETSIRIGEMIKKTIMIVEMATLYPAFIDAVLAAILYE
ncbi:MAG: hypothetical protein ACTSYL_08675 [Candidatus Thorarchaeota archaeon]